MDRTVAEQILKEAKAIAEETWEEPDAQHVALALEALKMSVDVSDPRYRQIRRGRGPNN